MRKRSQPLFERCVIVLAAFFLAPPVAALEQPQDHRSEIRLFGSTMAIARTVRETCRGTQVDDYRLEAIRLRLHVVEADYPVFAEEARAVVAVLKQGIAEAASRQAWCEAAYRLYGPNGTMIPGLMSRAKP